MPREWIDIHDPNLMGKIVLDLANLENDLIAVEKVWLASLRTSERIGHYLEHIFQPYFSGDRPKINRDIVFNALQRKSEQSGNSFRTSRIADLPREDFILQIYTCYTELRINSVLPLDIKGNRSNGRVNVTKVIVATVEPIVKNDTYDTRIKQIIPEILIDSYYKFDFSSFTEYEYIVCPQKDIREEYERWCPLLTHHDWKSPYYKKSLFNEALYFLRRLSKRE